MFYTKYSSEIGDLFLINDGRYLTHISYDKNSINGLIHRPDLFTNVIRWLDDYFMGKKPKIVGIEFRLSGTEFQKIVWNKLQDIKYGETISYGDIAKEIAKIKGIKKMSSQAVGQAVGANPISILIPCHRVVGKDNSLTGYGGGILRKIKLLELEGHSIIRKNQKELIKN